MTEGVTEPVPTGRPALTLAFIAHAPNAAAQELERLEPDDAAALIADTPARLAAPVVHNMSAWSGARCLAMLDASAAAAILRRLAFHDAAAVLRLLPGDRRRALYAELPARSAHRLQRALEYPSGSVGAWLDPEVPSFAASAQVRDALRFARDREGTSHVFVHAEPGRRLAGAVSVVQLLKAPPDTALADAGLVEVRPLSSRASLAAALAHPGWDDFLVLPVVARNQSVVGGLTRAGLGAGLAKRRSVQESAPGSVAMQLLIALGIAWSGLVRLLFASRADHDTA